MEKVPLTLLAANAVWNFSVGPLIPSSIVNVKADVFLFFHLAIDASPGEAIVLPVMIATAIHNASADLSIMDIIPHP